MNNNIYKEYAELKAQKKILEEREDELKTKILLDMREKDVEKLDNPYGHFSLCIKKKWLYSRKLQKEEEALKIAKIEEQESGKAKSEETEYITFKPNEND